MFDPEACRRPLTRCIDLGVGRAGRPGANPLLGKG